MPQPRNLDALPLPTWLLAVGSLVILGHLVILGVSVLAAPSGPWPTPEGGDMAPAPQFALALDESTRKHYLRPLKMTHNYHFETNRAGVMGVYLEVRLKDDTGEVKETLRLPDPRANPWVRHRQELLARHLLQDRPVPPPAGEVIAAPGQPVPTTLFWDGGPGQTMQLETRPHNNVPRNRPLFRPSELSLILARSFARHLGRTHEAAKVEIIRHSREPLSPIVYFQPELPPMATMEFTASFGEMSR